jgi:hypothetical protein
LLELVEHGKEGFIIGIILFYWEWGKWGFEREWWRLGVGVLVMWMERVLLRVF